MEKYLPEEIITDILSRLPVESVLEYRLVCKTWRDLTSLPSFAHLHARRSHNVYDDIIDDDYAAVASPRVSFITLVQTNKEEQPCQLYYGKYGSDDEPKKKIKKIAVPPFNFYSEIVGSCDGLICLSVYHDGFYDPIYICNPITREYIYLPRFESTKSGGSIVCGFGRHPKTNEYKVVRIFYGPYGDPSGGKVQVYTLGSGTGWRNKGEIRYRLRHSISSRGGCLANGALHWINRASEYIVCFDLADEVFRFLPKPPCYPKGDFLHVLGGFLYVVECRHCECIKLWSWKNKHKKSSSSYDLVKEPDYQSWSWTLEFCKTSKVISSTLFTMDRELALTKSHLKSLQNCFSDFLRKGYEPFFHTNSFVSLKGLGEDAKTIRSAEGMNDTDRKQLTCSSRGKRRKL